MIMPLLAAAIVVMNHADVPRPEHPRPDQVRPDWVNLNGTWDFAFDDADQGIKDSWQKNGIPGARPILVPYPYQAPLSGIGTNEVHNTVWYHRTFTIPEALRGRRLLLRFGAVDYEARVWLNGHELGSHKGGHVPFSFEIPAGDRAAEYSLVIRVTDTLDKTQPRGKQYWEEKPTGIFYTRTTGIWQTVWIEAVGDTFVREFQITPFIDSNSISVEVHVDGAAPAWEVVLAGKDRKTGATFSHTTPVKCERAAVVLPDTPSLWSPEEPNLYDLTITLREPESKKELDHVDTYFGMRKISIENGRLCLNNKPYYQKLILDQGYWPESILAAPSDDALRRDVEMAKAFGFNGARKHQKIEDPRWAYWADTLGFLVWGEMPAQYGRYTPDMDDRFISEWLAAVQRDYNHPCIVSWTPFNETWGIEGVHVTPAIQRFVERIYHFTKAADPFRPVCDNSGWDHVLTDIADYHDYAGTGAKLVERFRQTQEGRYRRLQEGQFMYFVEGKCYGGQPIVLSEFGGVGLTAQVGTTTGEGVKAWAYGAPEADIEKFLGRYRDQIEGLASIKELAGMCYTQLTDVGQEMNGLLTYDRKPKCDPKQVAEINALLGNDR